MMRSRSVEQKINSFIFRDAYHIYTLLASCRFTYLNPSAPYWTPESKSRVNVYVWLQRQGNCRQPVLSTVKQLFLLHPTFILVIFWILISLLTNNMHSHSEVKKIFCWCPAAVGIRERIRRRFYAGGFLESAWRTRNSGSNNCSSFSTAIFGQL